MPDRKRLILCLDGTWNNEDDSTNVLHHYNLIPEGVAGNGWIQKKKYQRGVGTGVLDSITGGGFGFGLENNVRDGYNWLVENYHESDEIYIFGFSRGAFTARSLVGFIGACGLLRRAAPITVGQLWDDYMILGRQREEREPVTRTTSETIRRITDLVKDPWLAADDEARPNQVRGQRDLPRNVSEHLLIRWSRRVKITYLGVYDTVGAIGWDALAFPGLRGRLTMHHNLRPTTIIQKCRHALAIQEYRTSFNHTPFMAFVGHIDDIEETKRATGQDLEVNYWNASIDMWNGKIEQQWFVGAHSNVGGGYANNRLSAQPFKWMLEGASDAGLACEGIPENIPLEELLPLPNDSYAQFVPPLWVMILRAKRNYRLIAPASEPKASLNPDEGGFSLHSIQETVDPSVKDYFRNTSRPLPPNLYAYAQRNPDLFPGAIEPTHSWFGEGWEDPGALVLWASLAAVGFVATYKLIWGETNDAIIWIACVIAFAFPIIDWGESYANFRLALGRPSPKLKAFSDSVYWTRSFGVVFFFVGCIYFVSYFVQLGWTEDIADAMFSEVYELHWLMPVFAVAGLALANAFDGASKINWKHTLLALLTALAVAPLAAIILLLVSSGFNSILLSTGLGSLFPRRPASAKIASPVDSVASSRAAMLLLLEFGLFYFMRAFPWVAEPMAKANLGSIRMLQKCATSHSVSKCIEDWRKRLVSKWRPEEDKRNGPAALQVRSLIREALWRDVIGFIPVYTLVMGFGLWFGAHQLKWKFLIYGPGIPVWACIPLIAAIADYAEDAFHFSYIRSIERDAPPKFARLAWTMTQIKFIALGSGLLLTLAVIFEGSRAVIGDGPKAGWNGAAALLVFGLAVVGILLVIAKQVLKRIIVLASVRSEPRP